MGDWQTYVDQTIHILDYDTNEWTLQNVCSEAAIYGLDGSCWAFSPGFPELKTYKFPIEDLAGNTTEIDVNEVDAASKAADGVRNPTDAGIRLGNEKYMLTHHGDVNGTVTAQLARRGGGGAAIAKTNTAMIIALFSKDGTQSDGLPQAIGNVAPQVAAMAAYLKEQGF